MIQAGGLATLDGGRLQLTAKGRIALRKPPAEVIRQLWQRWLTHAVIDEFSRIDEIKGQRAGNVLTSAKTRRQTVAAALASCPPNEWISVYLCGMRITPIEADHDRMQSRLRPMRGLKQLRCVRVISTGHAFVQNIRRGHYELGSESPRRCGWWLPAPSSPSTSGWGATTAEPATTRQRNSAGEAASRGDVRPQHQPRVSVYQLDS